MRTTRLKITAENYDGLKRIATTLPKRAKGNSAIRETLNISAGTWHYLKKSKDFEDFEEMQKHHNDGRITLKNSKLKYPKEDGFVSLGDAPQPRPEHQIIPSLDARAICSSIDKNTHAILKLVEAWQTKSVPPVVKDGTFEQPVKKGWLR
jgi:hypothetical protein